MTGAFVAAVGLTGSRAISETCGRRRARSARTSRCSATLPGYPGSTGVRDEWMTARARHILLETEEMADACLQQLEENPDKFEELARTLSRCKSSERGGDLGWFARKMMVPEFENICFNNEIGSLTKVKTPFGWHVLRVDGQSKQDLRMSVEEFGDRYNDLDERAKLQLVDVRERPMFEAMSFEGFTNLPVLEYEDFAKAVAEGALGIDMDKETVVVCHMGGRSEHISKYLAQQGYPNMRYLDGGLQKYIQTLDPSRRPFRKSQAES